MPLFPFSPPLENLRETPNRRRHYVERFEQLPGINADVGISKNVNFELLGVNAASADLSFAAGGGFNLASHGGTSDSAILAPHLDTLQTSWSGVTWTPSKEPHVLAHFKTDAALTNTTLWFGLKLTNTPVITTDIDQVMFRFAHGTDTTWQMITSVANADVQTDSGVTVGASTRYRLWITVDSGGRPTFWINGVPIFTGAALTAAALLIPYFGVLSATDATAKKVIFYELEASILQS